MWTGKSGGTINFVEKFYVANTLREGNKILKKCQFFDSF